MIKIMKIQNLLNNAKILFIVLLSGFCFQANAQVDSADLKMRIRVKKNLIIVNISKHCWTTPTWQTWLLQM